MRKLVSIQVINRLTDIPGKDNICLATILGWTVIVKKSEFKEGDFCLYYEIDSFLPIDEVRYAFLAKSKKNYLGTDGYRIKTMKLGGVISQGLALPLSMFPEIEQPYITNSDVSEVLKVIKYDRAEIEERSGKIKTGNSSGNFPYFIPKTDQTRIQSLPHYFDLYRTEYWEESLKLDGSSMTVYKVEEELPWYKKLINKVIKLYPAYHFGVCSRNLELKRPPNYSDSTFWKTAVKAKLEQKLPIGFALQGELIGPNIQSNHEKVSDYEYHIFDVYDIKNSKYLDPFNREQFLAINKLLCNSIKVIDDSIAIFEECPTMEDLLERVKGESINPHTISEGRVYKLCSNPQITFKCINNDYLLKEK